MTLAIWTGVAIFFLIILWNESIKYSLPIKWRLSNPRWDAFLCSQGSHRCRNVCGMGCCWSCIRPGCH